MRFKGLDLNLLHAFDVLMEERSVSRAARRLNLSQPAMSAALARLRDYFRDELLVAHGKRMHPTVHAEGLVLGVKQALRDIDALLTSSSSFDPATSERIFRIVTSDYVTVALLVPLITRLAEEAPGIRLDLVLPGPGAVAQISEGKADLLITPDHYVADEHPAELLYEEDHVVVGWAENPIFARGLSARDFEAAGHVSVSVGSGRTPAFADRELELQARQRRIEVTCANFTSIPWLVCGTMRLALMQERLVAPVARQFPIAWAPVPFPLTPMREMMQHHRAREPDEGLRWLRERIRQAARSDKA